MICQYLIGPWEICMGYLGKVIQTCKIALRSMSLEDDKYTLVQAMAWCCQATTNYVIQCWPRSMLEVDQQMMKQEPGARPTMHNSIEFEIQWKFRTL